MIRSYLARMATLYFEDMRVPAEHLMGEENLGFIAIMENFNLERVALIAGALGMMRVCLAESIDWAQTRQTFGKPLIRRHVMRHKIADMSARIDAVEAYLNQICWNVNSGDMPVAEICKAKFCPPRHLNSAPAKPCRYSAGPVTCAVTLSNVSTGRSR